MSVEFGGGVGGNGGGGVDGSGGSAEDKCDSESAKPCEARDVLAVGAPACSASSEAAGMSAVGKGAGCVVVQSTCSLLSMTEHRPLSTHTLVNAALGLSPVSWLLCRCSAPVMWDSHV